MQISQGLSIKNTLGIFAAAVAALFIIVGVIAYGAVGSFRGTLEDSTANASLLRATGEAQKMHDAIRADVVTYLLAFERGETEWMDRTEKALTAHKKDYAAASTSLGGAKGASAGVRGSVETLRPAMSAYSTEADRMVTTAKSNLIGAIAQIPDFEKSFATAGAQLSKLAVEAEKDNSAFSRDSQSLARNTTLLVALTVVLGLVALGLVSWWTYRVIAKPIDQVLRATEDLRTGQGDLTRKLPVMSGDFGKVSVSMN
ncbi:MAG: hypothetical protein ABL931_20645, partial [Usitatibacteraceae bacterium]